MRGGSSSDGWKACARPTATTACFLMDPRGIERLSAPAAPARDSPGPPGGRHQQNAGVQARRSFCIFHRRSVSDAVHLAVLVPVFSTHMEPRPLGVLVLRVDPENYLYPYLAEWPAPSDTAETLIVRREGDEVVFLNSTRFRPNAALNLRISLENTDVLAVKAALGQTGLVEGADYRGEPVLGSVEAVPGSPWYLIARMDTQDVSPRCARGCGRQSGSSGRWWWPGQAGLGWFGASSECASTARESWRPRRCTKARTISSTCLTIRSSGNPSPCLRARSMSTGPSAKCWAIRARNSRDRKLAGDHSSRRSGIDPAHGRCAPFRRKRFCTLHQEVYPQERLGCVG